MRTYIGERETVWLFVLLFMSRFLLCGINGFVDSAGSMAYISLLVCAAGALLIFWITNKVISLMKYTLGEMMNLAYGKKIGFALRIMIFALTVLNASSKLRMYTAAVGEEVLISSPIMYIMLFFVSAAAAAAFFGIEPLTRYSYIAGILILTVSAVICAMNIKHADLGNLLPTKSMCNRSFFDSFSQLYMFSDVLYLYSLPRFLKSGKSVSKIGMRALTAAGIAAGIITFFYCAAVPYPSSMEFKYPYLRLASLAEASILLQRMEGFVYLVWIFSGFISVGATAVFALNIFSDVFDTSDAKGTLPLLIFIIVVIACSKFDFERALNHLLCIAAFVLPLVTAVPYRVKARRGKG